MSDAPGTRSYIPPSEEERLKQRIAELEAELEAVEILVKAVGEGHTHIALPLKPYNGEALDDYEGSEILTLQAYAKTLEGKE